MLFFLLSRKGPTAGYAGSDASGDASSAVRRSVQEPTEETSQNQRGSVGILSVQGEEDVLLSSSCTPLHPYRRRCRLSSAASAARAARPSDAARATTAPSGYSP